MPAVDSLLTLITNRAAQRLELASGEVPRLTRAGNADPLAMPRLDRGLVELFVIELFGEAGRETLRSAGESAIEHRTADGQGFHVRARAERDGFRLFIEPAPHAGGTAPGKPGASRPTARVETRVEPEPVTEATVDTPLNAEELRPAPEVLAHALAELERVDGSDLILSERGSAHVRTPRGLQPLPDADPGALDLRALFAAQLSNAHRDTLEQTGSCDLALDWPAGPGTVARRYRVNLFRHANGLSAVVRPVRTRLPTPEELRLPRDLLELVRYPNGLVLITGASGSGKSTTLVALIEVLNQTAQRHIITLEDPIEYLYRSRQSVVHQREVGRDVDSFATGLRAALRENPDVILLGEMRDHDTVAAALTAAETGHLVLSTLHAGSAATAIDRIVDSYPATQQEQARYQLAGVLRAVVTQQLVPSRSGRDRVPAFEKMLMTPAVGSLIRENRTHLLPNQIQTSRAEGMYPMERSLEELRKRGVID